MTFPRWTTHSQPRNCSCLLRADRYWSSIFQFLRMLLYEQQLWYDAELACWGLLCSHRNPRTRARAAGLVFVSPWRAGMIGSPLLEAISLALLLCFYEW